MNANDDKSKSTLLDDMIDWEDGHMTDAEEIKLFQELVNTGLAWQLQGMYGRNAKALIDAGFITDPRK